MYFCRSKPLAFSTPVSANKSIHPSINSDLDVDYNNTTSTQQESAGQWVEKVYNDWTDHPIKRNVGSGNRKTTPTWSTFIALLKIGPLAAACGTIGDVPVVHWSWRHCACPHPRRQPTLPSHDGSSSPLPQAEIAYPCFWNCLFWEDLSAVKAFVSLVWRWTLRKVAHRDCWLVIGFSVAVHIMKAAPKVQLLKMP